jgi:hypothetical protein
VIWLRSGASGALEGGLYRWCDGDLEPERGPAALPEGDAPAPGAAFEPRLSVA